MEQITNLNQSFANASAVVRNQLAKQFEPLINKITKQMYSKNQVSWDTIKSMAYEGFVLAMNTYDPTRAEEEAAARAQETGKSKKPMNFAQFAAYSILNNIRTSLDREVRTVRMTNYMQQQVAKSGGTLFTSVSMAAVSGESGADDNKTSREYRYGCYEEASFEDGDIWGHLFATIDERFNETDRMVFYRFHGFKGYEETKVCDLAKELGVTSGRISQRLKKVYTFIKQHQDLCDALKQKLG